MPTSVELVRVPKDDISKIWGHVRPLILEAAKRGGGDIFLIEKDVVHGPDTLWLAWDGAKILAAAITSLGFINNRKICTIVACGGDEWVRFGHWIDALEEVAKKEGCSRVRINGRPGWQRALKGYGLRSVVLEKEI